jgi:hypothetical protein
LQKVRNADLLHFGLRLPGLALALFECQTSAEFFQRCSPRFSQAAS